MEKLVVAQGHPSRTAWHNTPGSFHTSPTPHLLTSIATTDRVVSVDVSLHKCSRETAPTAATGAATAPPDLLVAVDNNHVPIVDGHIDRLARNLLPASLASSAVNVLRSIRTTDITSVIDSQISHVRLAHFLPGCLAIACWPAEVTCMAVDSVHKAV
jgi:hypothetical protein